MRIEGRVGKRKKKGVDFGRRFAFEFIEWLKRNSMRGEPKRRQPNISRDYPAESRIFFNIKSPFSSLFALRSRFSLTNSEAKETRRPQSPKWPKEEEEMGFNERFLENCSFPRYRRLRQRRLQPTFPAHALDNRQRERKRRRQQKSAPEHNLFCFFFLFFQFFFLAAPYFLIRVHFNFCVCFSRRRHWQSAICSTEQFH